MSIMLEHRPVSALGECGNAVVVRLMAEADLTPDFLCTLNSLAETRLSPAQARKIFRQRARAGVRTYVAVRGDKVVGTATLLVERKFIHGGGLVGHIEDVVVRREGQGGGVGSLLVRHVTQEARRLGCYKALLNCFEHVAPFYERLGYKRHDLGLRASFR